MKILNRLALLAGVLVVACGFTFGAPPSARAATPAGGVDRATGIATCNALLPTNGVGAITAANVRQCNTLIWNSLLASLSQLLDCASASTCLANLAGVSGPASSVPGHIAIFPDATGKALADGGVPNSGVAGPGAAVVGHAATYGNVGGTQLLDSGTTLRQILTATTTFYVNASSSSTAACGAFVCQPGADSNNCLTASTPCQTIQHTANLVSNGYDFAANIANIQLADGTYNECVQLPSYSNTTSQGPYGSAFILGHSGSVGLVTVNCSGGNQRTFQALGNTHGWTLKNITVTSSGTCVYVDTGSIVSWDGGAFGTCTSFGVQISGPGTLFIFSSNYTITGNAAYHVFSNETALITWNGVTATFVGTPTFSQALEGTQFGGMVNDHFATFSGAFTGDKYDISSPGAPFSFTSGATQFTPGSVQYIGAGSISTTEAAVFSTVPQTFYKFVDLYATLSAAPGAGKNVAITFRLSGSSTSLTCLISGASANTCHDRINVGTSGGSVPPGLLADVMVSSDAGSTAAYVSAAVVGD